MFGFGVLTQDLRDATAPVRRVLLPIAAISSVYNVLLLSGSFFMLLVYDDVLPSRSVPSLVGLFVLVAFAYLFQAGFDILRGAILVQAGTMFTRRLSDRVMDVVSGFELTHGVLPNGIQIVRDADAVRSFLSGPGPLALLDLPWVLLYLLVLAVFHWSLALLVTAGALVLIGLMIFNDRATRATAMLNVQASSARFGMAETTRRNAETIRAMGMSRWHRRAWHDAETAHLAANDRLAWLSSSIGGASKAFRLLLQSAVLALGAWLVIEGRASGGVIIASSILSARALAPAEQVIANWKQLLAARQAMVRLRDHLQAVPVEQEPMGLDLPSHDLVLEAVACAPPGLRELTVSGASFRLQAGDAVAVIGRSGSGKSTLARAICGIWPVRHGSVRLDGATLDQWSGPQRGRIVGYVPQGIELLPGTLAQNIARFEPDADRDAILAAARAADVHDLIVGLEGGYDYVIGANGASLSGGQQQRIALARALYGDPFLLVLDEANSNLDFEGERALARAIASARARGGIVVVIAHRASIVQHVSHVLVMGNGRIEQFGPRDSFMRRDVGERGSQPSPVEEDLAMAEADAEGHG
ncbi:type I secretion system permease/ATPase [Novosphingobium sp. 9]|uniref:type I secretion system permease/ATPase n=1 Tax=Novosphingobium sp. 9 TaxID=2025349 RepID=UPI0021B62F75|nr:type I secretion system permease/ATPase [Novosphingobium sp. 9]